MAKRRATPNVAFTRTEYTALLPLWAKIRDCLAGEEAIKAAADKYLPKPNAEDTSAENEARYKSYLTRALFFNAVAPTQRGLVGEVMAEDPKVVVPKLLEPLLEDVDGGGTSFVQQATKALSLVVAHGRCGLVVDYPIVDGAVTRKQQLDASVRPVINLVEPWDVINWRTTTVGGVVKLSLVVISEQYVTNDDGYELEWAPQWRVLRLDEQGLCVLEEWIKDPNNDKEYIVKPLDTTPPGVAQYFPTNSKGERLDFIPFAFIGATSNNVHPDLPPLGDLAAVNIAHYRNSADYEESCFIVGQPTPYFTGLTEEWVANVLKGKITLGSRGAVPLPEGGSAGLLQAAPNSMPKEGMEAKERLMVQLGAKLVEQRTVQRTAAEAGMARAAQTSDLATMANNVSYAYESALRHAMAFVDVGQAQVEGAIEVELNTSFKVSQMTPQERAQLVAEWQAGIITDEEMRTSLTRAGVATEGFEEWNDKRETQVLSRPVAPSKQPNADQGAE